MRPIECICAFSNFSRLLRTEMPSLEMLSCGPAAFFRWLTILGLSSKEPPRLPTACALLLDWPNYFVCTPIYFCIKEEKFEFDWPTVFELFVRRLFRLRLVLFYALLALIRAYEWSYYCYLNKFDWCVLSGVCLDYYCDIKWPCLGGGDALTWT